MFISLMDAFVLQIQSSHGEIQNMLLNWHLAFKSLAAALTYGYNLQLANDCQLSYASSGFCFCCCRLSLITMLVLFRDNICNVQRNMHFNTLNSK